jgi:hypothetical protein
MCIFQLREVGSQAIVRTMWCSRPDAHQLATSVRTMRTFSPDAPQCPADNDEDVWKSEQHRPDARSISIQQGVGFQ